MVHCQNCELWLKFRAKIWHNWTCFFGNAKIPIGASLVTSLSKWHFFTKSQILTFDFFFVFSILNEFESWNTSWIFGSLSLERASAWNDIICTCWGHHHSNPWWFLESFWRMGKSISGGQVFHLDHVTKERERERKEDTNSKRRLIIFLKNDFPSSFSRVLTWVLCQEQQWKNMKYGIWVSSQVPSKASWVSKNGNWNGHWPTEKWLFPVRWRRCRKRNVSFSLLGQVPRDTPGHPHVFLTQTREKKGQNSILHSIEHTFFYTQCRKSFLYCCVLNTG